MNKLSQDIVIVGAKRTAFGTMGGALKAITATDLAVHAAKAAVAQSGAAPGDFGHVMVGKVIQSSADAIYCARDVGLRAGLPVEVPALTVNRLCGSGFEAIVLGAERLLLGEAEVVLAGGTENMSQSPHVLRGGRDGFSLRQGALPALEDSLWSALTDSYCNAPMAITAENLATKYGIDRAACDFAYAIRSQQRWAAAQEAGAFADEIAPVELPGKKGAPPVSFAARRAPPPPDHPRGAGQARPRLQEGRRRHRRQRQRPSATAAAMVVLTTAAHARAKGWTPLARLVQWGVAGVDPNLMGIGPAYAIPKALERAGIKLAEVDLFDVNEAFAPQWLAVQKHLEAALRQGATSTAGPSLLGHPSAPSGARITANLVYRAPPLRQEDRRGAAPARPAAARASPW